jgi:hypothetical protein
MTDFLQNTLPKMEKYATEIQIQTDPKKGKSGHITSILDRGKNTSKSPAYSFSIVSASLEDHSGVTSPRKATSKRRGRDKFGRFFRRVDVDSRDEANLEGTRRGRFLQLQQLALARELESIAKEVLSLHFDDETSLLLLRDLVQRVHNISKRYFPCVQR